MARGALCVALVAGCADFSRPAIFPEGAAQADVVQEQSLVGLAADGDAAAAQLIVAENDEPRLTLLQLDRRRGEPRELLAAPPAVAQAVAARVLSHGTRLEPLLAAAVAAAWPEAQARAAELGFATALPAVPEPSRKRYPLTGAAPARLPLALRLGELDGPPRQRALFLGDMPGGVAGGDEVLLARMPLSGTPIATQLFIREGGGDRREGGGDRARDGDVRGSGSSGAGRQLAHVEEGAGGAAWMLAGSVRGGAGGPLRRTVSLRGASLARGEAELHNGHGLSDYGAGELDSARREFDRAIAADPRYVDALYNGAAVAALADRTGDAVALLRRAVAVDPRRVQVLGRDDDDLRVLRRRPDVRALLGLFRRSPEDADRPPAP